MLSNRTCRRLLAKIRYFGARAQVGHRVVHGWTAAPSSPDRQLNRAKTIVGPSKKAVPAGYGPRRELPRMRWQEQRKQAFELNANLIPSAAWQRDWSIHDAVPHAPRTRELQTSLRVALIEMLSKVIIFGLIDGLPRSRQAPASHCP